MSFIQLENNVAPTCTCCYNRYGVSTRLADAQIGYVSLDDGQRTPGEIIDELGYHRTCCRQRILQPASFYLRDTPEVFISEKKAPEMVIPVPTPTRVLDFP